MADSLRRAPPMTDSPTTGSRSTSGHPAARNPGSALDLAWVLRPTESDAGLEERMRRLRTHARLDLQAESQRLLRALRAIDLTSLAGDDTAARIRALCHQAAAPVPPGLAGKLSGPAAELRTASVCVHHHFLPVARDSLQGTGIPVAVVSAGFPTGLSPLRQRIDEVGASVAAGADEIDAVINRSHVLSGDWQALYDEVSAFRDACGGALLKIILATGELRTTSNVARASRLCMLAGADFIKTSTGKEAVNAAYPTGWVMLRAIRDHHEGTGVQVGFKPAGGIRTPEQALEWMWLVEDELGEEALGPERFRLGASGLLGEIVGRLAVLHNEVSPDEVSRPPLSDEPPDY